MLQQGPGDLGVAGGVHQEVRLHQEPVPVQEQHLGDALHGGRHVQVGAVGGEGGGHLLGDQAGPLLVEGEEQLVEAAEVGVEGTPAVPGRLADLLDRHPPEPLGGEHRERRVQQVGAGVRAAPGRAPGRLPHRHARPSAPFDARMYRIRRCIERVLARPGRE